MSTIVCVPAFALYKLLITPGSLKEVMLIDKRIGQCSYTPKHSTWSKNDNVVVVFKGAWLTIKTYLKTTTTWSFFDHVIYF